MARPPHVVALALLVVLAGAVLPVAGSALAAAEQDRAEAAVPAVDCEPEFVDGSTVERANGSVKAGVGNTTECVRERRRAVARERRDWVLLAARGCVAVGWAMRLGGTILVVLAVRTVLSTRS
jgi:hypothetical protein